MDLNHDQQLAVEHEGNLLVIAPPGSGKSGTLIIKTKWVLRQDPANRVGLVTFTDAASKELVERLGKVLSPAEMKRVLVATFHRHCIAQLRAAGELGQILGPQDAEMLLQRAISHAGGGTSVDDARDELEKAKLSEHFTGEESEVVRAYEELKRARRRVDLMDVVRDAVVGMRAKTVELLAVSHLFGDEYQDTDPLQQEWFLMHAAAGVSVTAVGDDDQSIYGWRRAMGYKGMLEFERRARASRIVLQINYRSRSEILLAAQAVIRNNTDRVAKAMHASRGSGGRVLIKAPPSPEDEAEAIAKAIINDSEKLADDSYAPRRGRWAIIGRTNALLNMITAELRNQRIAYRREGGKDQVPQPVMVMCQLLTSIQTGDPFGIESALFFSGLSERAITTVRNAFGAAEVEAIDQVRAHPLEQLLMGNVPGDMSGLEDEETKLVNSFARLAKVWRQRTADGRYGEVITAVESWVKSHTKEFLHRDLAFWASKLRQRQGGLHTRARQALEYEPPKDGDGVQLHTMHSCKGLEFDRVVVIGANQGTIPSKKAVAVDEERRLFFVAVTRAKEELVVCHDPRAKSSFVAELEASLQTNSPGA